jgi:NAD+ synthase (glutamine-hydrolysing)
VAWDGHALIYENNELLAEANRFAEEEQMIAADIDLERLAQDRMRWTSFNDAAGDHQEKLRSMRRIGFEFQIPEGDIGLLARCGALPLRAQ